MIFFDGLLHGWENTPTKNTKTYFSIKIQGDLPHKEKNQIFISGIGNFFSYQNFIPGIGIFFSVPNFYFWNGEIFRRTLFAKS